MACLMEGPGQGPLGPLRPAFPLPTLTPPSLPVTLTCLPLAISLSLGSMPEGLSSPWIPPKFLNWTLYHPYLKEKKLVLIENHTEDVVYHLAKHMNEALEIAREAGGEL